MKKKNTINEKTHLSWKIYSTIKSHNANQFSSTSWTRSLITSLANPLETLVASTSKKKKKEKPSQPLDSLQTQNAKKSRAKGRKIKKERKKERKTVERSSRGASSRGGESRESIGMRGNFNSPSLSLASSLASVPKLSSVGVQLLDRTRDTATRKYTLKRNSPLFISVADWLMVFIVQHPR